jgi:hypothetical protein
MKLTNKTGLPQPVYDAVKNDGYSKGRADASLTELIGPPRIAALKRQFEDQIEEDVADRIYSLLGQSVHTILERANKTGIAERRFYMPVNDWVVSGAFDAYYSDGLLQDYKLTTAWSVKNGVKTEWEAQLNCGRILIEYEDGDKIEINKLQIVAILRDWSKLEAKRDPQYPQSQIVVIDVPLWTEQKAHQYLRERVILHQQARISLPRCTDEDRWAKPPVFAVMKMGRVKAVRLYDTREEADKHAAEDKTLFVKHRPGDATRCKFYCSAAPFCDQQKERGENENS